MRRLMRFTTAVGIVMGGFVSLVGCMALVGTLTDNGWVRFLVALVIVVALPALVADRVMKLVEGGVSVLVDVFAMVLLAAAMLFVGTGARTSALLVHEGDRFARSGSRTMARATYFLAGVSPEFSTLPTLPESPENPAAAKPGTPVGTPSGTPK